MDLNRINQKINQDAQIEAQKERHSTIKKNSSLIIEKLLKLIQQTIWAKLVAITLLPIYMMLFIQDKSPYSLLFLLVFFLFLFVVIVDIQKLKKFQSEISSVDYTTPTVLFQTILKTARLKEYLMNSHLAILVLIPILLISIWNDPLPENWLTYLTLKWVKEHLDTAILAVSSIFIGMFLMSISLYANQYWLDSVFKQSIQDLQSSYENLLDYKNETH